MMNFEKIHEKSLKFKAFKLIDFTIMRFFYVLSRINLNNTINIFSLNSDNSVSINFNQSLKLYAIELVTNSNSSIKLNNFDTLCNEIKFINKSYLMMSIVKRKEKSSIYIFSTSKDLLTRIATSFNVKLLTPTKVVNALYDIFLIETYEIKEKKIQTVYDDNQVEQIDLFYKKTQAMLNIACDNLIKEHTPYQICSLNKDPNFSIIELLKASWEGVIHLYFNFELNAVNFRLNNLENQAKFGDKNYVHSWNNFKKNEVNLNFLKNNSLIVNGVMFLNKKYTNSSSIVSDLLKCKVEERYLNINKILSKTLLLCRDTDFDIIVDRKNAEKYFTTSLAKDCCEGQMSGELHNIPDIFGKDINNSFMNYMFKRNNSPHSIVLGTTGSGKSVAILKMIAQIIDFDYEKNYAKKLNENRKIRFCNVGFSGGKMIEYIKNNSILFEKENKVEILQSQIDKLQFTLFDFDTNYKEEDILFLINFINLILDVSSQDLNRTLNSAEINCIRFAIKEIYKNNNFPKLKLNEIRNLGKVSPNPNAPSNFDNIIDEILDIKNELGEKIYSLETRADQLPEKYQKRFNRPIVADLLNEILSRTKDINLTELERQSFETCYEKLKVINNYKIFNSYSNLDLDNNYPFYYIDFDNIKEDKAMFVCVGWLCIKQWFYKDKKQAMLFKHKNLKRPDSFYIIEEAHNFLKIPIFLDLIEVFAREVRKYGIHLILVTQNATDIPVNLLDLFETQIFIFSEQYKSSVYSKIVKLNNGELKKEDKEVFDQIVDSADNNKFLFIRHSNGVNALKLPNPSKEKIDELFKPYVL